MRAATLIRADLLALRIQRGSQSQALVVAVHETPPSMEARFREQLEWVSQHFTITTFETFAELWENPFKFEAGLKPRLPYLSLLADVGFFSWCPPLPNVRQTRRWPFTGRELIQTRELATRNGRIGSP